ncbi:hypothetical protein HS99_0008950 [Kitasatospora aureofaciens]|uniref:Uncharacterized protein n=1 Tax=Kitasatospora aureofaciens TaxID=1894 RepID=A0A1E7N1S3_KITAU|nr:hypothetical protein B6264_26840 [Kitasatospora aureofaciens]OEV34616.1 hypothetical protein HS99_0008950 [Kitasatospora aureofaciens]GGV01593.1 hypothetical protein GCM10010502_65180 [Kitasatospora aureofaciens]
MLVCRLEGELGARALQQDLRPGDRVAVRGRLAVRYYRGDDGIPRSATLFHADGFGPFLGCRPSRPPGGPAGSCP